ncbi:hypothetical protein BN874_630003 [Candidatus Contendobacter odensis Run_B_J11]|uniref:NrtR DNA-binding winged helix domain-containing protein n=2 Tax=Candidatus Contendibacter odensensis TaxID=1400860 RepID=A0A7U7GEI0_9GAMM|nr:hypothetical protein [Candidatus Contendobacter odensis]CDH46857.1 hypothetical protein BN874_630003 [Candidatus Contendobacter odensis Run_B_J11]
MNELHRIYEQTIGIRLDKASFRHKILEQGIIEPLSDQFRGAPTGSALSLGEQSAHPVRAENIAGRFGGENFSTPHLSPKSPAVIDAKIAEWTGS